MTAASDARTSSDTAPSANTFDADILVIGGGPAGVWAALTAATQGLQVVLTEKGFVGTGGATAAGNTTMIYAPPQSDLREAAIKRRWAQAHGLADLGWIERVVDEVHLRLNDLADWGYPFPVDDHGRSFLGSLRGPDYLRLMRRRLRKAGVRILDQSPALELLMADGAAAGASGINRVTKETWTVRAGAVVIATGGCAFLSNALGTNGLTGDGLLLAAEAGAVFSGMEFTAQYGIAPAFASVTKGIMYFWATFTDEAGNELPRTGDRQSAIARHLLSGPAYAVIDKASLRLQEGMRRGQPNMFLPFDRRGIDPFTQRFPVTLRSEGTVRGVGGLSIDRHCATNVPGLFAAGDAASREHLVGATSGGGGPNASWAMATGNFAGKAAAAFVTELGPSHRHRRTQAAGGIGLRPDGARDHALNLSELTEAVQNEMLPLDRNYFRTGPGLEASRERLNDLWRAARRGLTSSAQDIAKTRETVAMLATARWILAAAIERRESRGLHRRLDFPQTDPAQQRNLLAGGLDRVWARPAVTHAETPAPIHSREEALAS
ncbi:MAG: dependent oxidoreductase [Xanthobacteraceae bacterium]|nr:dependent oxidoreductase [Xanthobacteraceae bacterium]